MKKLPLLMCTDGDDNLEPLAEVEGALLVVEVLHAPHPELGGLLLVGGEHFCASEASKHVLVRRLVHSTGG